LENKHTDEAMAGKFFLAAVVFGIAVMIGVCIFIITA